MANAQDATYPNTAAVDSAQPQTKDETAFSHVNKVDVENGEHEELPSNLAPIEALGLENVQEVEKQLVRRLDWTMMPCLWVSLKSFLLIFYTRARILTVMLYTGSLHVQLPRSSIHCVSQSRRDFPTSSTNQLSSNSQARISSLDQDLNLEGSEFSTAVSILVVGYVNFLESLLALNHRC